MQTFIERGTRFSVEVGTEEKPEVIRWTNWGNGPLQQCFALMTGEGVVLIDPGRPVESSREAMDEILGDQITAVVCTTALHERNMYWFRERYGAKLFVPKVALGRFDGTPDHTYVEGDDLPGGVKAFQTMDATGETVMHWSSLGETDMLINGDSIYGQSELGGFDCVEHEEDRFWMQVGGVRFRLGRLANVDEMKRVYEPFLELDFDLILNGHNPKAIDRDPKGALEKVIAEGNYEIYGENCTYLWVDLPTP